MSKPIQRSWRIAQQREKQTPRARHYSTALHGLDCKSSLQLQRSSASSIEQMQSSALAQSNRSRRQYQPQSRHFSVQQHSTSSQPAILGRRQHHPPRQWHLPSHQHNVAPFSTSARALVAGTPETMKRKQKMGTSITVAREKQKQELLRTQQLPDDVGILPGTFVMPFGAARPSWFNSFRGRKRLEKKRLLTRLQEGWSAVTYRFFAVRPRPRLQLRQIPKIAEGLYTQMYKALASCTVENIRDEHCTGLRESLRKRVLARGANPRRRWKLHKHLSKPKLVSYKVVLMPKDEGGGAAPDAKDVHGMVQAVVRIHSLQSLLKIERTRSVDLAGQVGSYDILVDAKGRTVGRDNIDHHALDQARATVEYVVVQQQIRKSRPGKWMLWGVTEPMTLEKLDAEEAAALKKDKAAQTVPATGKTVRIGKTANTAVTAAA